MAKPGTKVKRLSKIRVELVKKGRRTYGGIYRTASGRLVYLAHRKLHSATGSRANEIFCHGKSLSEAVRAGIACWAIDDETLIMLRARKIPYIGVLAIDTDDIWVTTLDKYFDKTLTSFRNFSARGGSLQRFLPLQHFKHAFGPVAI